MRYPGGSYISNSSSIFPPTWTLITSISSASIIRNRIIAATPRLFQSSPSILEGIALLVLAAFDWNLDQAAAAVTLDTSVYGIGAAVAEPFGKIIGPPVLEIRANNVMKLPDAIDGIDAVRGPDRFHGTVPLGGSKIPKPLAIIWL